MKVLNVLSQYIYVYEDGKVVRKPFSKEKGIVTSFLYPSEIVTITKKFSTLDEEDVLVEMEEYIYSYPKLKDNKEYSIIYQFVKKENFIIVEALLVDIHLLERRFEKILDKFNNIKFISPAFLGWSEYYKVARTDPKNDIFIYFSENESFLTAFSDGKYLLHKSLNKLISLSNHLGLKEKELINILREKGLDKSKYEDIELFNKVESFFSEFFLKIFNLINFSISEYELKRFDRIFFYAPWKINFLIEYYKDYWELNHIDFQLVDLNIEYNHLEYLITIFNAKNYKNDDINFSTFSKSILNPIKILSIYILGLFTIFLGGVVYELNYISKLKSELQSLNNNYKFLKRLNKLNIENIKSLNLKLKKSKEKRLLLNKEFYSLKQKVDILVKKGNLQPFYNVFVKVVSCLKKYNLKINKFEKNGNSYLIVIKSNANNTFYIAKFMQDLLKENFKDVSSNTIKNTKGIYISYVKFKFK